MIARNELLHALDDLEGLQEKSRSIPHDRGREILDMRRLIAAQNVKIAALGETAFERADQREAFRRKHAKLRAVLTEHLASWPVVAIDRQNPAYTTSLAKVREEYRSFFAWVRKAADSL